MKRPLPQASIVIRDAANMTLERRKDIGRWFDRVKRMLLKHPDQLPKTFTEKYQ